VVGTLRGFIILSYTRVRVLDFLKVYRGQGRLDLQRVNSCKIVICNL
jgi:hypothetical protein